LFSVNQLNVNLKVEATFNAVVLHHFALQSLSNYLKSSCPFPFLPQKMFLLCFKRYTNQAWVIYLFKLIAQFNDEYVAFELQNGEEKRKSALMHMKYSY
jgi:hypothetical protein